MEGQRGRRHSVLTALMILAALAMVTLEPSASAKDAQKIPGYGSKSSFQAYCEQLGGTFIEDGLGNTECHYPDGGWTECDANGDDCWYTPQRPAPPAGNEDGTIPSVPIVDGSDQDTPDTGASADDDSQSETTKHHKGKKGKKHGRHGKGHKK